MRVALCDDEKIEVDTIERVIHEYAVEKNYDIHCEKFTSGRQLLAEEKFDLYFLDYKMDEMDGIQLANALKEKYSQAVTICYLTNYENAAVEIINARIHADGFLKKPADPAAIYEKIDFFYKMSYFDRFELKVGRWYKTIYAKELMYVEAQGKKSVLRLVDGSETVSYLISDLEQNYLPGELFVRIQRSFIVNLLYVDSFDARTVKMKNGDVISLKMKNFRNVYNNFQYKMN